MLKDIEKLIIKVKNNELTEEEKESILSEYRALKDAENENKKAAEDMKPVLYAILGENDELTIGKRKIYVKAYEQEDKAKTIEALKNKYESVYNEVKRNKAIVSLYVK